MLSQITRNLPRTSIRSFSAARTAKVDQPTKNDSFNDRERAQEGAYIKKHEAEQLKQLREKLEQQKGTIEKLEKEINNIKK